MGQGEDRRVTRTRTALIGAFNHLVLERRQRQIRVRDIVAEANVGRSTFYDHYSGTEDIHLEALARPFALLADALTGRADAEALARLLDHFWQNRQRARETLSGRTGERAARLLADLVEERLEGEFMVSARLVAVQLAESALSPIRAWAAGEASCSPQALGQALCRSSAASIASLRSSFA